MIHPIKPVRLRGVEYFSLLDLSNIPAAGDFPNEVLAAYLTTPSPDIPASDTPSTYRAHSSTRRSPGVPLPSSPCSRRPALSVHRSSLYPGLHNRPFSRPLS